MKKIFLFIAFLFTTSLCYSQDIASCCTSPKDEGRCTGSASCTACTNCSRCAHCGAGGSCGVCREPDEPKPANKRKPNTDNKDPRSTTNTDPKLPGQFETIQEIDLRSGPGENFRSIAKIRKGTKLIKAGARGQWTKVSVINSDKTGYVLTKYIR